MRKGGSREREGKKRRKEKVREGARKDKRGGGRKQRREEGRRERREERKEEGWRKAEGRVIGRKNERGTGCFHG